MKKVLCVCAAALVLAFFSTSCNKKCTCKTYTAGVVVKTYEIELDKGQKCADYTGLIVEDPKTGVECR